MLLQLARLGNIANGVQPHAKAKTLLK